MIIIIIIIRRRRRRKSRIKSIFIQGVKNNEKYLIINWIRRKNNEITNNRFI